MKSFVSILVFLICFVQLSADVHAQTAISSVGIELSTSVKYPTPGQTVTITARSFSDNIQSANIVWRVDGQITEQGIGKNSVEVTAPSLGQKKIVNISAETSTGKVLTGSLTLGSGSIDLIMESDGYTPPFFHGKVMPSYQNIVKIIAIPHIGDSSGREYDPKTLTYTWSKNDKVLESQSGYGVQSIEIVGDIIPRPYTMDVVVSAPNGDTTQASIYVPQQRPSVAFYTKDPLYGPLFNIMNGGSIHLGRNREKSVLAVPFGFSGDIESLVYNWSINGTDRPDLTSESTITLRAPEGTDGTSSIALDILNNSYELQSTDGRFSALFTNYEDESESVSFTQ